jgi:hypothetical protein
MKGLSERDDVAEAVLTLADRIAIYHDFAGEPGYCQHISETIQKAVSDALEKVHLPDYTEWSAIERLLAEPSGEAPDVEAREQVIA